MDSFYAAIITLLCAAMTFVAFQLGEFYKALPTPKDERLENRVGLLFIGAGIATFMTFTSMLAVQPWRIGIPNGGGIMVYHKNTPPAMTEEDQLKEEMTGKSDHEAWMIMHRRLETAEKTLIDRANRLTRDQNTDRERIMALEHNLKKSREEVFALEKDLRDHLSLRGPEPGPEPDPVPEGLKWPRGAR